MKQLPDAPWLEPDEPRVVLCCDKCKEPIYEGDEYYDFYGDILCAECGEEYVEGAKKTAEVSYD